MCSAAYKEAVKGATELIIGMASPKQLGGKGIEGSTLKGILQNLIEASKRALRYNSGRGEKRHQILITRLLSLPSTHFYFYFCSKQ